MINVSDRLGQLEAAELVRRLGEAEKAFLFKHALTQETAYASLLKETRHTIHRHVAESVEALFPEQIDENAALLAHHFGQAQDDSKALVYAIRAGDVASRVYANEEAIAHYSNALEISKRGPRNTNQLIDLYLRRGRRFELMGKFEHALGNYSEMELLANRDNDKALELSALIAQAIVHSTPNAQFEPEVARELANRSLQLADDLDDRVSEARVLWALLLLNHFQGRFEEAIRYGERSVMLSRELHLREQLAFSLNDISRAYLATHQFEKAGKSLSESRTLWRELDNKPMLADNLNTSAAVANGSGDYDGSLALALEAYDIGNLTNNDWTKAHSLMNASLIYWDRGQIDFALRYFKQGIYLAQQVGFYIAEIQMVVLLARLQADTGDLEGAIETASVSRYREKQAETWDASMKGVLATIYIQKGDLDRARRLVEQSKRGVGYGLRGQVPNISTQLAEFELALIDHDFPRASEISDALLEALVYTYSPAFHINGLVIRSRLLVAQGRPFEAEPILNEARSEAESVGALRELWRILSMLAHIEANRGNQMRAEELYDQATEVINQIAAQTPVEFRESFLNTPEIRHVRDAKAGITRTN